jgi:outer membrane protein assembly factor BamD
MKCNVLSYPKSPSRQAAPLTVITLAVLSLPSCILVPARRGTDPGPNMAPGDQPDKVLYLKAKAEIDHGRYDVGRLTLQTMINTYPDSEYLSKAKLLTADSYYKEGGISGLTQAEAEYNDFITFFPTAPEAPEAKYRAGMSHFRLMGKPDRDLAEAESAQQQFKQFLEKYPDNDLVPLVKGRLREVQEVLAQGDYETATLYFKHGVNRAAASRFKEIADSYPDFSEADQALWYLGQSEERLRKSDEAASAYARLLTYYPLSSEVKSAQTRLVAMRKPVPRASKATLARARADRVNARRVHTTLIAKARGELSGAPDLSATRHGPVRLGPQVPSAVQAAQTQRGPINAQIAVQPVTNNPAPAAPAVKPKPSPAEPAAAGAAPNRGAPAPNTSAPRDNGGAAAAVSNQAKPTSQAKDSSNGDPASTPSSGKKKGKFHFLWKIVP